MEQSLRSIVSCKINIYQVAYNTYLIAFIVPVKISTKSQNTMENATVTKLSFVAKALPYLVRHAPIPSDKRVVGLIPRHDMDKLARFD